MLRFWRATINSRNGLAFAIRSEQAIREEVVALALSLPLAWLVGATVMRRVELVATVVLVLVIELLNTAIEKLAEVYVGPLVGGGIEAWAGYVVALVFLLVRPSGLFGQKLVERV